MTNKLKFGLLLGTALVLSNPVNAADLGGNCCADLEERIAELEATTARKGNRKVSLEIYGQVNAQLLSISAGDFDDQKIINGAGDANESYVGFRGNARINNNLSAGYVLEIGLSQLGLLDSGLGEQLEPAVRQSYWYLKSETLGGLTVGKAAQATWGFNQIGTAGVSIVALPNSLQPLSDAYLTGIDIPYEGQFRNIVRYDSPTLAGFKLSASWGDATSTAPDGDGETYDVALRYAGEFEQFQIVGGVGYRHDEDFTINVVNLTSITLPTGDVDTVLASGSIKHVPTGLFFSAYWADQDWDDLGASLKSWTLQGGVSSKFLTGLGATTPYLEYSQTEASIDGLGSADIPVWGLGVIQNIDAAAMSLYAGYRQYDLDELVGEKVDVIQFGAKVSF